MKWAFALVVFAGCVASSQAFVMIDDFVGSQTLTVTGTNVVSSNGLVTAGAIGGVRRLVGINDVNPGNGITFMNVGGGSASFESGPRVDPRVELGYGANINGGLVDMNADLTVGGANRIRIQFDSNDNDLMLRVFMRSTTGTGGSFAMAFSRFVAGGRAITAFDEDLLFSTIMVNPSTLTDLDNMVIQFDTTAGGDVSLRGIAAVPEPTSVVALALGTAALIRRHRRK